MRGEMQPQSQVLWSLIDFHLKVQKAAEHIGSATPMGLPMKPHRGTVQVEAGMSDALVLDLTRYGHEVQCVKVIGGYQVILIQNGVFHGGSEPCKYGLALCY